MRAALRCLAVVVAACGGDMGDRGSLEVERITRGDTLIVRTRSAASSTSCTSSGTGSSRRDPDTIEVR
jgi:hypothetical protein